MNRPEIAPVIRATARPRLLAESDWSAALTGWVSAAMAFLGVLTLAAGLSALQLAETWRADLAGVATVRVSPGDADGQARIAAVVEVLRTTPGIARIHVLDDAEQAALLSPWLGEAAAMAELPAPRLIDVQLEEPGPDAAALQNRLDLTVSGAVYDDHAAWREPLARTVTALTKLAFAATGLVLLTAGAMVAYAARATLGANAQAIQLVRLVGGEDRFISRGFVRRLARRAGIGAAAGTAAGCIVLALLPDVEGEAGMELSLAPSAAGWVLLAIGLPLATTLVAWLAAQGAMRLTLWRMP